jgi:hypothetical protein
VLLVSACVEVDVSHCRRLSVEVAIVQCVRGACCWTVLVLRLMLVISRIPLCSWLLVSVCMERAVGQCLRGGCFWSLPVSLCGGGYCSVPAWSLLLDIACVEVDVSHCPHPSV